jgi:cytochrome bd-type quinol oxidase subunit 1
MGEAPLWHRLQFVFTIMYHYLFPQLTMGLALLIVIMKALALRTGDATWESAAGFWIRSFGITSSARTGPASRVSLAESSEPARLGRGPALAARP